MPPQDIMKHPTSRLLHAYWDGLRRGRAAPDRREVEPGAIRNLLADSLILEVDVPASSAAIRLAGTRVCALFGRELRTNAFADLWGAPDADPWRLVETVAVDTLGVVAGLTGTTARNETIDLELILLPLRHRGQTQTRILGALSPHVVPHWLGLRPVTRLSTTSLRVLGPDLRRLGGAETSFRDLPAPANDALPFRRGHLLVHPGGRG